MVSVSLSNPDGCLRIPLFRGLPCRGDRQAQDREEVTRCGERGKGREALRRGPYRFPPAHVVAPPGNSQTNLSSLPFFKAHGLSQALAAWETTVQTCRSKAQAPRLPGSPFFRLSSGRGGPSTAPRVSPGGGPSFPQRSARRVHQPPSPHTLS